MRTKTAISVEEYLQTSFPGVDPEYRDGEIVERTFRECSHGCTQALPGAFFIGLRMKLPVFTCCETRMKVREGGYVIPDVAVFWQSRPELVPDSLRSAALWAGPKTAETVVKLALVRAAGPRPADRLLAAGARSAFHHPLQSRSFAQSRVDGVS